MVVCGLSTLERSRGLEQRQPGGGRRARTNAAHPCPAAPAPGGQQREQEPADAGRDCRQPGRVQEQLRIPGVAPRLRGGQGGQGAVACARWAGKALGACGLDCGQRGCPRRDRRAARRAQPAPARMLASSRTAPPALQPQGAAGGIKASAKTYRELRDNLGEGLRFYTGLQVAGSGLHAAVGGGGCARSGGVGWWVRAAASRRGALI